LNPLDSGSEDYRFNTGMRSTFQFALNIEYLKLNFHFLSSSDILSMDLSLSFALCVRSVLENVRRESFFLIIRSIPLSSNKTKFSPATKRVCACILFSSRG
jgi:hypothetical protein